MNAPSAENKSKWKQIQKLYCLNIVGLVWIAAKYSSIYFNVQLLWTVCEQDFLSDICLCSWPHHSTLKIQRGHNAHDYTPPLARVLTLPSTILSSSCLSSLQSRVTAFVLSPATAVTARGSNGPELQLPPWSASDGNEEILCLSHFLSFSRLPFWLFPLFPPSLYLCEHFIISALLSGLYCYTSLWVLSRSVSPDPGFVSFCFNGASEPSTNNNEVSARFVWIGSLALAPGYECICPLDRFYTG